MAEQVLELKTRAGASGSDVLVIELDGPLMYHNLFDFQQMVRRTDAGVLIVDLTNVPYMDSAGLGCLVGAHVSYSKNSRRLALVGVNQRLRDLFSITQVGQFFRTYANVDDAERDRGTGAATAR